MIYGITFIYSACFMLFSTFTTIAIGSSSFYLKYELCTHQKWKETTNHGQIIFDSSTMALVLKFLSPIVNSHIETDSSTHWGKTKQNMHDHNLLMVSVHFFFYYYYCTDDLCICETGVCVCVCMVAWCAGLSHSISTHIPHIQRFLFNL